MRVLVIDDDPDQVIIRCMVLSHHGFETRRASDAESALKAVREDVPEVAVVDLGLPAESDGLHLIAELNRTHPEISVVVLTGSNIQRLREKPELHDVAGLVEKGGSCQTLLKTLNEIADDRAARAS
jgi:DNA-binding NtrC family response regulator